jgi:hypothetical protein
LFLKVGNLGLDFFGDGDSDERAGGGRRHGVN